MAFEKTTLPNGVRIVSEYLPYVECANIGVWFDVGSRDETDAEAGISHVIEHMMFKGTEKRTQQQIANEVDNLGAGFNAFTGRYYTCYYLEVLKEDVSKALDILSDMVINSVYDETELDKEKGVVLEEIKRGEDDPESHVHSVIVSTLWKNHPTGRPIIGYTDTVKSFTRQNLVDYRAKFYIPSNLVISAAGNIEHKKLVDEVANYFGYLTGSSTKRSAIEIVPNYETVSLSKDVEQVNFAIGYKGFSTFQFENKYATQVLVNAFGGSMSSRLWQEIREKRGLAYSVGMYQDYYHDGGFVCAYGGVSKENFSLSVDVIQTEIDKIINDNINEAELKQSQNMLKGSIARGGQKMYDRMQKNARNEMVLGYDVSTDEVINHIMSVTLDDTARVIEHIFGNKKYTTVAIGNFNE